jgi:hypothetical protein
MKKINAHELPFLLDRNTNTDEILTIEMIYDDIMSIEFQNGEEITFEATPEQVDWFNNLPEPVNPDENKPGCPGCVICGPSTDPAYYEHERWYNEVCLPAQAAKERAEAERRSDERHALKERGWEAPPVDFTTFCNCAGGPNTFSHDCHGLQSAYCENCGCII